ncbi:AcrR family transcriptional regulator [Clostridium polyendosporum]|uniref:AcrR family transcriptional regulator n=1 Tax=Clostridium polyendosporum TaxID=69208 RepID=A0A919RYI0_9CLOT|nr:TetR/AcrR family transcriptional regulator [Clostridium polyendosporum]GIM28865.1 AcrR family transcriptional regulator [Clostridium polyendosporum]
MPKETFFNLNEEKQEKIMRTAISEFLNQGFEKGNIGDIAKNAGVSKGSMYQYFENKKELFLFSVQWSMEFLMKRYNKYMNIKDKDINIFDLFYQNSKEMWLKLRDEREIVIFIEDVFLGKYSSLTDESMAYMMKVSDEYLLKLIQDGKSNGYIRKDIDDKILSLFITGVSLKIKEYLMNKARTAGEDIIDEDFEVYEREIKAMIELIKNGMGA